MKHTQILTGLQLAIRLAVLGIHNPTKNGGAIGTTETKITIYYY